MPCNSKPRVRRCSCQATNPYSLIPAGGDGCHPDDILVPTLSPALVEEYLEAIRAEPELLPEMWHLVALDAARLSEEAPLTEPLALTADLPLNDRLALPRAPELLEGLGSTIVHSFTTIRKV